MNYGNFQGLEFNSVQIEDFRYAKKKTRQIIFYDGNYGSSVPFKFDTFVATCLQMNRVLSFKLCSLALIQLLKQYGIMGYR